MLNGCRDAQAGCAHTQADSKNQGAVALPRDHTNTHVNVERGEAMHSRGGSDSSQAPPIGEQPDSAEQYSPAFALII